MPLVPNVVIWGSLMAACRVHNEFELGEFAAKRLLDLDPNHDGAHVLLSNIYAKERRWEDVREVRRLMKHRGVLKERGYSRVELNNGRIHKFLMADRNHKEADEIYAKLDEVVGELKLLGYAPNTCDVLVDLDEDEKKEVVLWHSEKLALCYGLMEAEKGSCIRIIKNLRICEDCHAFMKLVSKVYQRSIIVRDRTRFHYYKDGVCSCKDYW
ncbi:Pentatricopeptide repeat-containing protein [Sarracenia purpurea var. burkii]